MQIIRPNNRDNNGKPIIYNSPMEAGLVKTNWDLSKFVLKHQHSYVGSEGTNPYLSPDGKRMFLNYGSNLILRDMIPYNLSTIRLAENQNVASWSCVSSWTPSGCNNLGYAYYFKPEGTTLYSSDDGRNSYCRINRWDNITAWEYPMTQTASSYIDLTTDIDGGYGIFGLQFKPDGTKMYVFGTPSSWANKMFQYTLSTPWDITTATLDLSVQIGGGTEYKNAYIIPDGTKLILCNTNGIVYAFAMANPWTFVGWDGGVTYTQKAVATEFTGMGEAQYGVTFNEQGSKMFVIETSCRKYYEYVG